MRALLLTICVTILTSSACISQNNYNYTYYIEPENTPSTFKVKTKKNQAALNNPASLVSFQVLSENKDTIPYAQIKISSPTFDTLLNSGENGQVTCQIPSTVMKLEVRYLGLSTLESDSILVEPFTLTHIQILMGYHYDGLSGGVLHCKKKLTPKKLNRIIAADYIK